MTKRILLVDDEIDFLDIMSDLLEDEGYSITTAVNGAQALEILARATFDLLISDINMPGMKGFELLGEVGKRYPLLKTALITAYDVRDYITLAKHANVSNIITKSVTFDVREIVQLIGNLLTEEVFGLERYINGPIQSYTITHSNNIDKALQGVLDSFGDEKPLKKFKHALGEIIINAVYYGARNERGDRKETWQLDIELPPHEAVVVSWGADNEKAGVAVRDQKGRLTKEDVLHWLERNTTRGNDGLSIGVLDEHGKGIFISRETSDRLLINIKKTVATEIIMLNYRQGRYDGHKPLWIHEFK